MTQEIKEIEINNVKYVPKNSIKENKLEKDVNGLKYVLIRSKESGVHIGYLKTEMFTESGKVVVLLNTRRVWYWSGAASISQLALEGTKNPNDCKITVELAENEIVGVIETIPLTSMAFENLNKVKDWTV